MSQHTVAGKFGKSKIIALKRRVYALQIAVHDKAARLIYRHPPLDTIRQRVYQDFGIVPEQRYDPFRKPTALFINPHRHIPMEYRYHGLHAVFQQRIDQIGIELQSFFVDLAFFRHDARPTDRKTVGFESYLFHQRHVLAEAVIMITGGMTGLAVPDLFFRGDIPDRRRPAVLVPCAFDLRRRGRSAP